jgi:hypothetical protein
LSAGVYIASKWVSSEMPPWALGFWRVLIAWAILLPIVRRRFGEMIALVRTRALELVVIGGVWRPGRASSKSDDLHRRARLSDPGRAVATLSQGSAALIIAGLLLIIMLKPMTKADVARA